MLIFFFRVSFIFIFQNVELCRLQFLLDSTGVRLELKGRKKEFQVGGIQTKTDKHFSSPWNSVPKTNALELKLGRFIRTGGL